MKFKVENDNQIGIKIQENFRMFSFFYSETNELQFIKRNTSLSSLIEMMKHTYSVNEWIGNWESSYISINELIRCQLHTNFEQVYGDHNPSIEEKKLYLAQYLV